MLHVRHVVRRQGARRHGQYVRRLREAAPPSRGSCPSRCRAAGGGRATSRARTKSTQLTSKRRGARLARREHRVGAARAARAGPGGERPRAAASRGQGADARAVRDGDWPQQSIMGVFNNNCMMRANYRNVFPIWALGEYARAVRRRPSPREGGGLADRISTRAHPRPRRARDRPEGLFPTPPSGASPPSSSAKPPNAGSSRRRRREASPRAESGLRGARGDRGGDARAALASGSGRSARASRPARRRAPVRRRRNRREEEKPGSRLEEEEGRREGREEVT